MNANELTAAAERYAKNEYYDNFGGLDRDAMCNDAIKLADAYLSQLAARRDEERERELPVDEAWLNGLGLNDSRLFINDKRFEICAGLHIRAFAVTGPTCWEWELWSLTRRLRQQLTRGQVLDLLAALGLNITSEKKGGKHD